MSFETISAQTSVRGGDLGGVDSLDHLHQRILQTFHALGLAISGPGRGEVCELLGRLYREVDQLFEAEVHALEMVGYDGLAARQRRHAAMVDELGDLQRELLRPPTRGAKRLADAAEDDEDSTVERISDGLRRLEARHLATRVAAVEDSFVEQIINDDDGLHDALGRARITGALAAVLPGRNSSSLDASFGS